MGWVDEDFGHEGYLAGLFADGSTSGAFAGLDCYVTHAPSGQVYPRETWQVRPATDIVGWVPVCACGWHGEPWMRVFEMLEEDRQDRTAFDESDTGEAPDWVLDLVYPEWAAHVRGLHDDLCPARVDQACLCSFIQQVRADQDRRRGRAEGMGTSS